jgi:hypothetical protein
LRHAEIAAHDRQHAREASQTREHGRGADGAGQANTHATGQQRRPQPEIKPLGKTAGEIRLAWRLTTTGAQFAQEIEGRGLILVHVSAEEAKASERIHAFAKATGRQSRALKEGFAVVDARGTVTRIDQRATGDLWEEIQKRLGGIDKGELLSAAAARDVMKEANRAAWAEQQHIKRESERPMTGIEIKIAEALRSTMTGHEFAEALDQAGLTITRATDADVKALDALRRDDELAASSGAETTGRRFAALEIGEFAAVTKSGDVFRLNPHKLDLAEIEQRLADVQRNMPSVTEARAFNEQHRQETAEHWAAIRMTNAAEQITRHQERAADRTVRDVVGKLERAAVEPIASAGKAADKAVGFFTRAFSAILQIRPLDIFHLFDIAPGKGPTKAQAEQQAKAAGNLETLHANAYEAMLQEKEEAFDWMQHGQKTEQQQQNLTFSQRTGRPPTAETRERDDEGREHERER